MHASIDLPAGTPVSSDAAAPSAPPQPRILAPGFTGDGREYFRIWVVNLLLTLATFGIYSAWAKVRRLQYFDRNTVLAGATFDFHGKPRAVLAGRLLSVVLLVAYHYAFGFSGSFGVAVVAILLLAFPYLMRGALRFRLGNTSYRGLSLGFGGSLAQAYLTWLPPAFTVLMPGVLLALYPERPALSALPVMLYLLWPLMHARIRQFQHANLLFGDQHSHYEVKAYRFYRFYLVSGGLILATTFAGFAAARFAGDLAGSDHRTSSLAGVLIGLIMLYLFYLLAAPYMLVRVSNLAWSNTRFPGIRFRSTLPARAFMKLQTKNALLTVLSLGLYRPFAVVSVYRFRLAHLHIEVDGDIEAAASHVATRSGAAGDGVADGFGIDLSW